MLHGLCSCHKGYLLDLNEWENNKETAVSTGPGELLWLLWPWPDQYLLGSYSHAYCTFCTCIKFQKAKTNSLTIIFQLPPALFHGCLIQLASTTAVNHATMATTLLLKQLICLYSDAYVRAKLCVNSMCMRVGRVKEVYGKEGGSTVWFR